MSCVVAWLTLALSLVNCGAGLHAGSGQRDPFIWEVDSSFKYAIGERKAEWPTALIGHNLIIAGDSNDRLFFQYFCLAHSSSATEQVTQSSTSPESPYGEALVSFPEESTTRYCHIPQHNASVMFFFHFGIMGESPEPPWHAKCMEMREHSHLAQIGGDSLMIPATHLAKFFWPRTVDDHLPKRPVIFLTQSSLWDSVCFAESEPETSEVTRQDLREWGWGDRVESFLKAVHDSSLGVERMLWRTNPNCPFGDALIDSASGAQMEEIESKRTTIPFEYDVVRWRANHVVQDPGQCAGIHYDSDGYRQYMESLAATLAQ